MRPHDPDASRPRAPPRAHKETRPKARMIEKAAALKLDERLTRLRSLRGASEARSAEPSRARHARRVAGHTRIPALLRS